MNLRKITSLLLTNIFILLCFTGIILFIVPHGRVAYWSNWTLLGINKESWGFIHINLGILFFIASILHIFYNYKLILAYLRNNSKKMIVLTPSFIIAFVIIITTFIGTAYNIPPFSYVSNLEEYVKKMGTKKYGNPPYGHAELSPLKRLLKKEDINLENAIERLRKRGIKFQGPKQSLKEIGTANGLSPKQLFEIIKGQ